MRYMEKQRIPKIIHYCWFGDGQMSEMEKKCIETWKRFCPDYEIREWNDSNYDISKCQYALDAAQNHKWSFVTDYVRLDVLYQYGGIYLDTDVEMLKTFDPLLQYEAFLGFECDERVNDGQGMGAVPHFEPVKELRDMYQSLSFYNEDGSLNLKECPQYRTEYLMKRGLKTNGERQQVCGIEIFPARFFCPKNFMTGKIHVTEETYSIHHFKGAWHSAKELKIIEYMQFTRRLLGEHAGSAFLEHFFDWKDRIKAIWKK